jgi:hypothetical protein
MRFLVLFVVACHAPKPAASPEDRVTQAIAAWGRAIASQDHDAIAKTEDGDGQFAFTYVATKAVASQHEDGAEAVERTVAGAVAVAILSSLSGTPYEAIPVFVPAGALATVATTAGLAQKTDDGRFVVAAVPIRDATNRMEQASEAHRARLRERSAWACYPWRIERDIPPTEPSLVKAAAISQHVFAEWLHETDHIWLVRGICGGGFLVSGHPNGDRVLLAL